MKTLKIGKSTTNDIIISDVTVSSQHAVITILDTREVRIKDLNSLNGTYVNGKRITTETSITANDVIKVANCTLDWVKHLNETKRPNPPVFSGDVSTIKRRKTIGREIGDIILNYKDVSSSHAQLIEKENGEIVIADSGSTNGTYVNGQRISMQTLHANDRVLIANKYPLDWQHIFNVQPPKPKSKKSLKTIFIAAAAMAAVIIGFWIWIGNPFGWEREKPWATEKIYAHYKKSVVMVEFAYYYQVNIDGKLYGYYAGLQKDKKGNIHAVISKNGNPRFFGGTGTGFIVSNDGKIVTNRHIVVPWDYVKKEEKQEIDFVKEYVERMLLNASLNSDLTLLSKVGKVTVEGKMYDEYFGIYLNDTHKSEGSKIPCSIIKDSGSDKIDIGVIQINSKTLPPGVENIIKLENAVVDDANIIVGKPVYTIGFSAGEFLAATTQGIEANNQDGKITQLRGEYEFGHNISIIGGASGSPVFNEYGNLIGVIHKGLEESQGYNMAIKAKYAVELAK